MDLDAAFALARLRLRGGGGTSTLGNSGNKSALKKSDVNPASPRVFACRPGADHRRDHLAQWGDYCPYHAGLLFFASIRLFMQITLLVGTVFGNARQIAQTLALAAPDYGASAQVLDMQDQTIAVFDTPGFLVLCCSTTGQGDVPDNAQGLYQSLDVEARYLGHVRYGLVALGDSSYGDTFYGGAKAFQNRLQDLGAQLVGDLCVLDSLAADDPDTVAVAWFANWVQHARHLNSGAS